MMDRLDTFFRVVIIAIAVLSEPGINVVIGLLIAILAMGIPVYDRTEYEEPDLKE